jgi:hypothetical protein
MQQIPKALWLLVQVMPVVAGKKDEPDGREIHNEARPVPGIHSQLYGDEWKGTCGSGLGTVLSNYVSNDTPDDPETGRKGTNQPGPRAGSIDQASG